MLAFEVGSLNVGTMNIVGIYTSQAVEEAGGQERHAFPCLKVPMSF